MNKLRKERWKILKHVFEGMKQAAEEEGNVVYYDGCDYSDFVITINDKHMTCAFVLDRSWHGIYDDSEENATVSAIDIVKNIRSRISICKQTIVW